MSRKKLNKERIVAYVDGFNLYFGLKDKGWKDCYWLNIQLLIQNLLKSHQRLVITKYFTSRILKSPEKQRRQETFIEALYTLENFEIFYGRYQSNPYECSECGAVYNIPKEKMTDVNISVEILTDAMQDTFDSAFLVSADSDLKPVILRVKDLFPKKRIIIAFPPGRFSTDLQKFADDNKNISLFVIGRRILKSSIFPESVKKLDGFILKCPSLWR